MKKLFLSFAVVAALASCSKNEVTEGPGFNGSDDPSKISFQPTSGTSTRGAIANIATLEGLGATGFEVIGIKQYGTVNVDMFGTNNDGSNNYIYTAADAQKWDWKTKEGKAWPTADADYPLRFFAAHPFPDLMTATKFKYDITPADKVADQKDQLSAFAAVTSKPNNGITGLEFQHILSAIKFNLMSSAEYVINIKEVSIVNVTETREFNYSTGAWSTLTKKQEKTYPYFKSTAALSTQTFTFPASDVKAKPIESGEFAAVAIADAGQMMLVPQVGDKVDMAKFKKAGEDWAKEAEGTDWATYQPKLDALATGAYIQVTYNMKQADGTYMVGKENNYVTVLYALDLTTKEWLQSKRYTYTLYLGTPDASNGTVLDPDYKDETGGGTDTPIDNPKVGPGGEVTKGNITFTVTVGEWTEGLTGNEGDIKK